MKTLSLLTLAAATLSLAACDNTPPAAPTIPASAVSFSWYDTQGTTKTPEASRASAIAGSQTGAAMMSVVRNPASTPEEIVAEGERVASLRDDVMWARHARIHAAAAVLGRVVPDGVTASEQPLVAAQLTTLRAQHAASPDLVAPALAGLDGYWSDAQIAEVARFALEAPSTPSPLRSQLAGMANAL